MNIKNNIKKVDIISFDIFDTLLFRPYVKPTDLFLHIEKVYKKPFFRTARMTAEYNARKNTSKEDITFDEIYMQMPQEFQSMKEIELEWEMMVLRPNPEMKLIWDYAKKLGKKIIVTSDMYLSSEFLTRVLHKNDFIGYDKLYVSGEIGKTKTTGTLFEYITNDLQVTPDKILHIGDNKKSDYKSPKKSGLRAILYPHIINDFIKKNPRFDKFFSKNKNDLGASILLSVMILKEHDRKISNDKNIDYWYDLGYKYAGPVIYSYMKWVENQANKKNIQKLLFIARDGYTLQKIFDTLSSNISTSYIYAPRYLNLICRLDYRKDESSVAYAQQRTIIEHYCMQNSDFKNLVNKNNFSKITMQEFLQKNIRFLSVLAKENLLVYKNYLNSKINHISNVALVDTITENFSAQKLVKSTLKSNNNSLYGFYWTTIKIDKNINSNEYSSFSYTEDSETKSYVKHWGFMEFLMTSPELPIIGISSKNEPIYKKDVSNYEKIIRHNYIYISNGAIDFAENIKNLFKGNDIFLTYATICHWVNSYILYPKNKDKKYMLQIRTATNPNNDSYEPLFNIKMPFKEAFIHPIKSLHKIRKLFWKSQLQIFILCIVSPISIYMRGFKNIKIVLLPKLNKNIFCITLHIYKITYSIEMGNHNEY